MNRDKRRSASPGANVRAAAEAVRESVDAGPQFPWSPLARGIASAVILFHLAAAFIAAVVASPPMSELSIDVATFFRPYVNAVDLNHGYRFFAPNPGPSHLVRYHLEFADGQKRDGQFPNLEEERPRLLYHRYFMLSEKLFDLFGSWQFNLERSKESPSPAERDEAAKLAQANNSLYRAFAKSYANELLRRTGAKRVSLELIVHQIPSPEDVVRGQRLDDPTSYQPADKVGPYGEGAPEEVR